MMAPEEEQVSMLKSRFSPKHRQGRRLLLLVTVVFFVVLFVIGIVIGYFTGKNASKCEDNQNPKPASPTKSRLDLEQIHQDAVELVSTEHLRDFLK